MMEIENGQGVNWEITDPDYYRKVVLRMYWDGSGTPNVIAPLGDFFCVGHSIASNFQSLPFTASVKPAQDKKFGGSAALNYYLPMPFNKRARIEVENQGDTAYFQYFYIDYEIQVKEHPVDTLFFHAHWRRQNPTPGWGPHLQTNSLETQVPNLTGEKNFTIMETTEAGCYIGCNHSVYHYQQTWRGEGDDMIWIDDDFEQPHNWPPSLHGTGSEDYFSQGWGMQDNAFPFARTILHEGVLPGYQVSYRWHLADPIIFQRRVKVTMEHGHANYLSDDWCSTAYWYQSLSGPNLDILPMEQRLPIRAEVPKPQQDIVGLTEQQQDMLKQQKERLEAFGAGKLEWLERREIDSRERAQRNKQQAIDIRKRFVGYNAGREMETV